MLQEEGKKKKRKGKKEEDFNHEVDEFEEIEEFNYLEGVLQQKKLEDENLEVFLIEPFEVKDQADDEEFEQVLIKEIGHQQELEGPNEDFED